MGTEHELRIFAENRILSERNCACYRDPSLGHPVWWVARKYLLAKLARMALVVPATLQWHKMRSSGSFDKRIIFRKYAGNPKIFAQRKE